MLFALVSLLSIGLTCLCEPTTAGLHATADGSLCIRDMPSSSSSGRCSKDFADQAELDAALDELPKCIHEMPSSSSAVSCNNDFADQAESDSTLDKLPQCIHDMPSHIIAKITMGCDPDTAQALKSASKTLYNKTSFFADSVALVGSTPAFIPAVKRCFMRDHVACYQLLLSYFKYLNKVEKRHLAQLPALAAQLGAVKIFQRLKTEFHLSPEHPSWRKWMTRAAIREQWTFVKTIHGDDKVPSDLEVSAEDDYKKRLDLYRLDSLTYDGLIPRFQKLKLNGIDLNAFPPSSQLPWLDRSLVEDEGQIEAFPSVEEIWFALKMQRGMGRTKRIRMKKRMKKRMQPTHDKTKRIQDLQKRIEDILSGGIYLMDDILPDPKIIVSLWLNHYKVDNPNSLNNAFLRFLLDEGAPIHDSALIVTDLADLKIQYRKDASLCKGIREVALQYTSGSGTTALANELHALTRLGISYRWDIVRTYINEVHANILDPSVLPQLTPYVPRFFAEVDFLVDQGLNLRHVKQMRDGLNRLKIPSWMNKERLEQVLDVLSKKIHKKQSTWYGTCLKVAEACKKYWEGSHVYHVKF